MFHKISISLTLQLFDNGYFVTEIVLTYSDWQCEQGEKKKCSSDWERLLKFEAGGQELSKFLRSLEQFIQTVVKGQNNCR